MKNISKILFLIIFVIQIPVTIRLPKSVFTGSNYLSNISSIKAETAEDFLLKASIKKDRGDLEGAVNDLNKALEINSVYTEAFLYRGTVFVALKEFEKAINDLNFVVKSNSKSSMQLLGLERRGVAKFFMKDYPGAAKDFIAAIEINPDEFPASSYKILALAKDKTNDSEAAILYFNKAIIFEPNSSFLYEQVGITKFKASKSGYCKDWEKASSLGSKNAEKFLNKFCS